MAILTSKNPVPISEGGAGIGGSLSTAEGAQLTSEKPKPSISVRVPLLSEVLNKV